MGKRLIDCVKYAHKALLTTKFPENNENRRTITLKFRSVEIWK